MENILSSRAMLCGLKISKWSARKVDKRVTAETNAAHNASPAAGRYNKVLLAKEALAGINQIFGEAYAYHIERTLPWLDEGLRILPAINYFAYSTKIRELRNAGELEIAKFQAAYPDLVEQARKDLNGMFNVADYPPASDIAERFSMKTRVLPMPNAQDFRVEIGDAQGAEIRAEVEAAMKEAVALAMRDAWERISNVVALMVERLTAYKPAQAKGEKSEGVFRDSLVGNVRDLVGLLPSLNLNQDAKLAAIVDRMNKELCTWDADELRENDNARTSTAKAAQAILDEVKDFLA